MKDEQLTSLEESASLSCWKELFDSMQDSENTLIPSGLLLLLDAKIIFAAECWPIAIPKHKKNIMAEYPYCPV